MRCVVRLFLAKDNRMVKYLEARGEQKKGRLIILKNAELSILLCNLSKPFHFG